MVDQSRISCSDMRHCTQRNAYSWLGYIVGIKFILFLADEVQLYYLTWFGEDFSMYYS